MMTPSAALMETIFAIVTQRQADLRASGEEDRQQEVRVPLDGLFAGIEAEAVASRRDSERIAR